MAGMLKFTCEQCGHRIATPPRRLGQLVTCPECGHATHPLAGEILSQRATKSTSANTRIPPKPSPQAGERSCANCGQAIGRLQKLQLWENDVVCTTCHRALANESSRAGMRVVGAQDGQHAPQRVAAQRRGGGGGGDSTALANPSTLAARATPINVSAATYGVSSDHPYAAAWRAAPLTARGRLGLVLAAFCFLAAAVYGALTLLRDLAGLIATVGFFLLGLVCLYVLLQASVAAGKRLVAGRAAAKGAEVEAIPAALGKSAPDR